MNSKGYGHTRGSGRLPRPSFNIPTPVAEAQSIAQVIDLARKVKESAEKLGYPIKDTIAAMRASKVLDCDDEAAAVLLDFAEGLKL